MKKRFRALAALWLAVIMVMGTLPVCVLAGNTDAKVFLIHSADPNNYPQYEFIDSTDEFDLSLDTPLNGQDILMDEVNKITPQDKELSGWNLWKGSASGGLTLDGDLPIVLEADGAVETDVYNGHVTDSYMKIALEPIFDIKKLTVIWANYDGTPLETDNDVAYGTLPTYDGQTPEKAADAQYTYTFDGWDKDIAAATGDVTYTAKYKETLNTYTVIWQNEDGTPLETDNDVAYGTLPTYDGQTPQKPNDINNEYRFDNWDKNIVAVVGDVTYTATYTNVSPAVTHTVIFDSNGGSAVPSETVDTGDCVAEPSKPVRSGYNFKGWYADAQFNTRYDFTMAVTDDITLHAKWKKKSSGGGGGAPSSYIITFDTDGGSEIKRVSVTRNTKLTEPTAPTKEGYTFDGWYTDENGTQPYDFDTNVTKAFTLYAKWTETEKDDNAGSTEADCNGGEGNCPSRKFEDLDIQAWYHADTDFVLAYGIFKGTTKTKFAPNGNITRAMMITVLYRAEGEPEVTGEYTFTDVSENAYYAKAVAWGQQNGIINGYPENKFKPHEDIIREQIAVIMHRYAQYKGYDVSVGENTNILSYDDFDKISEYAIPAMQWAVGSGMIKGRTDTTLNPGDVAARVEIAAMLHRFIDAKK